MKKMMLLALAAASVAMLALPAVVTAGVWHIESQSGHPTAAKPFQFSVHGSAVAFRTAASTIECGEISGLGNYTSTTTGSLELTFQTCGTTVFGSPVHCQSPGAETGVIKTTQLEFHNIMAGHSPAVLLTPNATTNVVSHFTCSFISATVEGTGIVATVTSPECGGESTSGTLSFTQTSAGVQADRTVTTSGTEYTLKRNNGEFTSLEGHATTTFPEKARVECT